MYHLLHISSLRPALLVVILAMGTGCLFVYAQAPTNSIGEINKQIQTANSVANKPYRISVPKSATRSAREPAEEWFPALKNTRTIPEPGQPGGAASFSALKETANANKTSAFPPRVVTHTTAHKQIFGIDSVGENFFGNLTSGTPNDNHIAISEGGAIVNVVNTSVLIRWASNPSGQITRSLATFFGRPANAMVFDPRVVYDPEEERFVVACLEGDNTTTSRILLAFSNSNDPFGTWNVYTLSGVVGNQWSDFVQIGLSTEELFLTTNLSVDGATGVTASAIWQVNKRDGYIGFPLTTQVHPVNGETGFVPVQGGNGLYGPNFYLVRANNVPSVPFSRVYIREINNTIANGGSLTPISAVRNLPITYTIPPTADQPDTCGGLRTNNCAITSAYYQNQKIQFGLNTGHNERPSLLYGTLEISSQGLGFGATDGQYISYDSLDIAFPGLAWCGQDLSGNNASILGFNFASPFHYPGNAMVHIDENGTVGPVEILKNGFAAICAGGSTGGDNRWGDYFGATARPGNPGEVWLAGSIGRVGTNSNGTWISQVFACGSGLVSRTAIEDLGAPSMHLYPNPVIHLINLAFEVPKSEAYDVVILDLQGRVIETFGPKKLKKGEAQFSFNIAPLAGGEYILAVHSPEERIYSKRFLAR